MDVVTGAVVERSLDARLDGPVPLLWYRHYSSACCTVARGLGWGQVHAFDHRLRFDLDGLRHTAPTGEETPFPGLDRDGDRAARDGWTLERLDPRRYSLTRRDEGAWEFVFARDARCAPPARYRVGEDALTLRYERARLVAITDGAGRRVTVAWDGAGRIVALTLGERALVRYAYDPEGNLAELTDRYGARVTLAWAAPGRLSRRTERTGYAWRYRYDPRGRCVHAAGEDGVQDVRLEYLPGRTEVTRVTRSDGGVWAYHHEGGALTAIVDPCEGLRRFVRDARGRLARELSPRGDATRVLYDAAGGVWARIGPRGVAEGQEAHWHTLPRTPAGWEHGTLVALPPSRTQRRRDGAGLRVREERDGRARTWRYDPNGNVVRFTDLEGATWRHAYASANHRVRTVDPLGHATSFVWDRDERLVEVTDPGGARHGFVYDLRGLLVEAWRDGGLWERLVRDAAGDVVERRDADGALRLAYVYGRGGLRTERRLATGDIQTLAHDRLGRLTSAVSAAGRVTFDHDAVGRRVVDERDGLGVRHRWGEAGTAETWVLDRFVTTWEDLPDGSRVMTDPTGTQHRLRRPAVGVVVRELASGWSERSEYDDRGRCTAKTVFPREAPERAWRRTWDWSSEGDLVAVHDSRHGTTRYTHDAAHRLASECLPDGAVRAYAYDPAGNLLRAPGLDAVDPGVGNRPRSAGGEALTYDRRGRLCARAGMRYGYDARDQMVAVEAPGLRLDAVHDALGRRVRKTVNGAVTTFWWDGDRLAAEVDPSGRLRVYVYADEGALTPMLVVAYDGVGADPAAGRWHSLHADHRGAPVEARDDHGAIVWAARVEAYGRVRVTAGEGFHQPFRFPGHYGDAETGLHDNRFRTYCPALGRYLQPDPIGLRGGINLYAYTANPLRQVDLRGLRCPEDGSVGAVHEPETEDEGIEEVAPRPQGTDGSHTPKSYREPTFTLGDEVFRLAQRSPRLAEALDRMMADLWVVREPRSDESQAFRCRRGERLILIAAREESDPQAVVRMLAHEVGHAECPDPLVPSDGIDWETFVGRNTEAALQDEGRAVLFNADVRRELIDRGGPDIGIAGDGAPDYQRLHDAVRAGEIGRDEAMDRIAERYGDVETVGGTNTPVRDWLQDQMTTQAARAGFAAAGP